LIIDKKRTIEGSVKRAEEIETEEGFKKRKDSFQPSLRGFSFHKFIY